VIDWCYPVISLILIHFVIINLCVFIIIEVDPRDALAHYSPKEIYESYLSELNPAFDNFVFIDEVQRKEGWENWIRKKYDLKHD